MKKKCTSLLAALAALAILAPIAGVAESTNASATVTVHTSCFNALGPATNTVTNGQAVLEQNLKMATNHDLLADAALRVGRYTAAMLSSTNLLTNTYAATAGLQGRALADGNLASLTATLGGAITNCQGMATNSVSGLQSVLARTCVQPQTNGFRLATMSTNSCPFALPKLASGYRRAESEAAPSFHAKG